MVDNRYNLQRKYICGVSVSAHQTIQKANRIEECLSGGPHSPSFFIPVPPVLCLLLRVGFPRAVAQSCVLNYEGEASLCCSCAPGSCDLSAELTEPEAPLPLDGHAHCHRGVPCPFRKGAVIKGGRGRNHLMTHSKMCR